MDIIDITIPLSEKTPVWEGEKGITIRRSAVISPKSDYNVTRIEMGLHSGTHVDAPFHILENGAFTDTIPLTKMVGPVQVVFIPENVAVINENVLKAIEIDLSIKKILFKTVNSHYWDQAPAVFRRDYVGLDTSAAECLVSYEMELIGIDFFSISAFDDLHAPHIVLLQAGAVILENLDLRTVQAGQYNLYCLPLKVVGADGAPARVILTRDQ